MGSGLEDLVVTVGGDISPLQTAFDQIPAAASTAASGVAAALAPLGTQLTLLDSSVGAFGTSLSGQMGLFSEWAGATEAIGVAAKSAESSTSELDAALAKLATSTQQANEGVKSGLDGYMQMKPALQDAGEAADKASQSFDNLFLKLAGGYLTFQGLKGAVEEIVTSFGQLERATEALGAITKDIGGAADNIQRIVQLSDELAVPQQQFLTLTQRLTALGVAFEDIPRTLEGIADGARAMNQSIDMVGNRFDMVINSGTLMNRTLTSMGLTIQDVGKAMGLLDESDKTIKDTFKSIADESERAAVMTEALWSKFGDLAAKTADDTLGAWQKIQNAGREAFQEIGQQLDGFKGTVSIVGTTIKFVADVILEFIGVVKQAVDISIGLGGTLSTLFAGMGKAAADILSGKFSQAKADMQAAVETATNYAAAALQNMKKDWADTSGAIDKLWSGAMGSVRDQTASVIPHIDAVTKAQKDLTASLLAGAEALLSKMPSSYDAYIASLDEGGRKASALLSSVNSEIDKFIAKMQAMGGATQPMLVEFGKLQQQQDIVKGWVDQDNFNKLALQIEQFVMKYGDSIGKLDTETLNWVNAMQAAAASVPDALNKISDAALLGKVMDSFTKLDASTKQWNESLNKVAVDAAKTGPQIVEIFSPLQADLEEIANKTQSWTRLLFDAVTPVGQIYAMQQSMKVAGLELITQAQNNIDILTRTVALMEQYHQNTLKILDVEAALYQKHIDLNKSIGASGDETLAWTIQLEKVKVAQQAIMDQTMGLSNLYTGLVKAFGTAWDSVGKSLADAVVSGQNFGQVMTSVCDTLKKQVAELVTHYLMTQLKDAILENTNLLGGFSSAFTSIFGGGGSAGLVSQGIGELDKAVATSAEGITTAAKAASTSITQTTQTAATGLQTIASTMASTILPMISAIASVIGAISGIIGNIEMGHMEKTLGQIETNTREAFNALGGGGQSIAATSLTSSQKLGGILETIQGTVITLLVQINADLDDIAANIKGISTSGLPSDPATYQALQDMVTALKGQLQVLQTQVTGAYGVGTAATDQATTTPAIQSSGGGVNYAPLAQNVALVPALTLADNLLISIAKSTAEILIALSDSLKLPLYQLTAEMIAEQTAGQLDIPLKMIQNAIDAQNKAATDAALALVASTNNTTTAVQDTTSAVTSGTAQVVDAIGAAGIQTVSSLAGFVTVAQFLQNGGAPASPPATPGSNNLLLDPGLGEPLSAAQRALQTEAFLIRNSGAAAIAFGNQGKNSTWDPAQDSAVLAGQLGNMLIPELKDLGMTFTQALDYYSQLHPATFVANAALTPDQVKQFSAVQVNADTFDAIGQFVMNLAKTKDANDAAAQAANDAAFAAKQLADAAAAAAVMLNAQTTAAQNYATFLSTHMYPAGVSLAPPPKANYNPNDFPAYSGSGAPNANPLTANVTMHIYSSDANAIGNQLMGLLQQKGFKV